MMNNRILVGLVGATAILTAVNCWLTNYLILNLRDDSNLATESSAEQDVVKDQSADSVELAKAWSRLDLFSTEITELELVIERDLRYVDLPIPNPNDQIKPVSIMVSDKDVLQKARVCFDHTKCLRYAIRPGVRGGAGNAYVIGTLRFKTTAEEFQIGIGNSGFSIDGNAPGFETEFFSPGGAEFISSLYRQQTKRPLPNNFLQSLSGLTFINYARNIGKY